MAVTRMASRQRGMVKKHMKYLKMGGIGEHCHSKKAMGLNPLGGVCMSLLASSQSKDMQVRLVGHSKFINSNSWI